MVTFHEIRQIMQKLAVLSSYVGQLGQLLPKVIQLTEQIGSINDDLTLERDRITAKMRSVQILGEILKTQIYQNQAGVQPGAAADVPADTQAGPVQSTAPIEGDSAQPESTGEISAGSKPSAHYPGINSGSLMI